MSTSDVPDISEIKRPRDMVPATERLMRKRGWLRKTPRAVTRYAKKYGMRREELREATNRALSMHASGVVWDRDCVPPGSWAKVIKAQNDRFGGAAFGVPAQNNETEGNEVAREPWWSDQYLKPVDRNGLVQPALKPGADGVVYSGPPDQTEFGLQPVDTDGMTLPPADGDRGAFPFNDISSDPSDPDELSMNPDDDYGDDAAEREKRRNAARWWKTAVSRTNKRLRMRGWARFSIS